MKAIDIMDMMTYRGPEVDQDGVRVVKFEIPEHSLENLRNAMNGRGSRPGFYHKLVVDKVLWMSDTDAEKMDHLAPIAQASFYAGFPESNALVNGLGMGLVAVALTNFCATVDVVEKDERIAKVMGPIVEELGQGKITIHVDDAFTIKWPVGASWTIVWHDIWPTISDDNLPEMARLARRYQNRCAWQGSWAKIECLRMKRQMDYYASLMRRS